MKRITELVMDECRWPVQSRRDQHLFCAGRTKPGETYCACHRAIAYERWLKPILKPDGSPIVPAGADVGYAPTPAIPASDRLDLTVSEYIEQERIDDASNDDQ